MAIAAMLGAEAISVGFLVTKLQLRDLSDEVLLHDVGGFRPLTGSIRALILEFAKRSFVSRVTKLELRHQGRIRTQKMDGS
ncbi:hypothetical protein [Thiocystis violacea]|uniref:hypothetical protein n=1 Tax=Thiocystis violacea TaxID=13725 RepID=UPI001908089A|nr:hypothetical protein [Thiocystis violacea]MBK1723462.1 hypothetical protein [Thiocystis violacea]